MVISLNLQKHPHSPAEGNPVVNKEISLKKGKWMLYRLGSRVRGNEEEDLLPHQLPRNDLESSPTNTLFRIAFWVTTNPLEAVIDLRTARGFARNMTEELLFQGGMEFAKNFQSDVLALQVTLHFELYKFRGF